MLCHSCLRKLPRRSRITVSVSPLRVVAGAILRPRDGASRTLQLRRASTAGGSGCEGCNGSKRGKGCSCCGRGQYMGTEPLGMLSGYRLFITEGYLRWAGAPGTTLPDTTVCSYDQPDSERCYQTAPAPASTEDELTGRFAQDTTTSTSANGKAAPRLGTATTAPFRTDRGNRTLQ